LFVQQLRQKPQHFNQPAIADPLLEAAMARLVRRILLRQLTPLSPRPEHPQQVSNTALLSCQGRPRRTPAEAGRSTGSTNFHCSSVNSQRPVIRAAWRHQSNSRMYQITAPENYETGYSSGWSRTKSDRKRYQFEQISPRSWGTASRSKSRAVENMRKAGRRAGED
jgi:hypothetical protein